MTSRERHVTSTLVQLADTLVAGYDVAEMFYYLVESCTDVLSIDHAGLMLVDADGNLHVVAATSEVTHLIELLQIQNQEGPCLDAFRSGQVVESGPLTDPEVRARWPRLTEAAHDAGFGAITAMPMRLRDQVLGALNLFRVETADLTADDLSVAQAFANIATISILQARATHDARVVIDQLQRALDTRVVIEQAKGFIAQHADITLDESFARIRRYSRNNNLRLSNVARDIVANVLDPQLLIDN
jgi:GAF domain-containing protein